MDFDLCAFFSFPSSIHSLASWELGGSSNRVYLWGTLDRILWGPNTGLGRSGGSHFLGLVAVWAGVPGQAQHHCSLVREEGCPPQLDRSGQA